MTIYADKNFYLDQYLSGKEPTIPIDEIEYWLAQASRKINRRAFGKTDALQEVPDEVKMCCCAVAEKLYQFESAKSENGMVLQSYGNDGETATYKTTDMSELAISGKVLEIIEEWLMPTGLLYCGVDM
nr:MAG TPA: Head Tail Connector Protein [Caudoviricetes sp.]